MNAGPQFLLLGGVIAVGVLHTVVPDHWLPITLLARQQGWSRSETAWAAARAGFGHVASTLLIGFVVWLGGVALAERFGAAIDLASSAALTLFGGWIAVSAWRELRRDDARPQHHATHSHGHGHHHEHRQAAHRHDHEEWAREPMGTEVVLAGLDERSDGEVATPARHSHIHRHGDGAPHLHWHEHPAEAAHSVRPEFEFDPPRHEHLHKMTGRAALVLILGSSPMVEGIPAFFAAGKYGAALIGVMAFAFALSTIATYVGLCVYSAASLQRLRLGSVERYGEVLSGALIGAIGLAFGILSIA